MSPRPQLIDYKILSKIKNKLRKKINIGNRNNLSLKVNLGIIAIFILILVFLFYIYTEKCLEKKY